MEFGKDTTQQTQRTFARANLLQTCRFMLRTCYGEVANLLRTCFGETGVMDFGLKRVGFNVPLDIYNILVTNLSRP